jgi:16S rRNA (guanine(966)-N(2))-methyltransferase RsmD
VIAGELRGRRLAPMRGGTIRPTSQRARAGLFDWLGPRVEGRETLDLFAGTGAIGIEALSRGASSVVFVERERQPLRLLRDNLKSLELIDRSQVISQDVHRALDALRRGGRRFGLLFADPPYEGDGLDRLARSRQLGELLQPEGIVILERSRRRAAEPRLTGGGAAPSADVLCLVGSKVYGETAFDWYERTGEDPA